MPMWLTNDTAMETRSASTSSGRAAFQTVAPAAVSHDQLAVAIQAIEHVNGRDQQRQGRDQRHQVGQRQQRHLDEHPRLLPLRGHEVELAQRQRDPDHAGQGQRG